LAPPPEEEGRKAHAMRNERKPREEELLLKGTPGIFFASE
jgi:hypothetical protein